MSLIHEVADHLSKVLQWNYSAGEVQARLMNPAELETSLGLKTANEVKNHLFDVSHRLAVESQADKTPPPEPVVDSTPEPAPDPAPAVPEADEPEETADLTEELADVDAADVDMVDDDELSPEPAPEPAPAPKRRRKS